MPTRISELFLLKETWRLAAKEAVVMEEVGEIDEDEEAVLKVIESMTFKMDVM